MEFLRLSTYWSVYCSYKIKLREEMQGSLEALTVDKYLEMIIPCC